MESRLEKIFSMGINSMSLAVWLGEDRKCSAAVVGLDLLLGLSMVRRCSLNRSFKRRFVSPMYNNKSNNKGQEMFCGCGRFRFIVRVIYGTAVFIKSVF